MQQTQAMFQLPGKYTPQLHKCVYAETFLTSVINLQIIFAEGLDVHKGLERGSTVYLV